MCYVDNVGMMAGAIKQAMPCIGQGLAPQALEGHTERAGFKQDVAHVVIIRMGRSGLTPSNALRCKEGKGRGWVTDLAHGRTCWAGPEGGMPADPPPGMDHGVANTDRLHRIGQGRVLRSWR